MSDNDFRGYVNYKGVREGYDKGSPAEYDAWLSDDNAVEGWENWDEREKAMERAEKEYNRRKKINDRISANEAGIADNREIIDGLNNMQQGPDAPSPAELPVQSAKMASAQAAVDAYDAGLETQGTDMFETAKQQVKDVIKKSGRTTRGPGSLAEDYTFTPGFDRAYSPDQGGGPTYKDPAPSAGPVSSFLNNYKLGIADGLEPGNRSSAIQNDKNVQRAHAAYQQGMK